MTSLCKFASSRLLVVLAIVGMIFAAGAPALAQSMPSDPSVDNGAHWYGTYDGTNENVSLSSGNLSFCIPLLTLRGPNKHDLKIPFCYNSGFQQVGISNGQAYTADVLSYFPWAWATNTPSGSTTPPMGVGWTLTGAPAYYYSAATSGSNYPVMFMPDGSRYSFAPNVYYAPQPDTEDADVSFNNFSSSQTLTLKDGTRYNISNAGSSSCPPGGCAQESFPDGAAFNWAKNTVTDAIGRTVTESSGSSFSGSSTTSSTAYVQFQYPDPVAAGTTRTVLVQMQTMQFSCASNQAGYGNSYGEVGSGGFMNSSYQYVQNEGPYSMPTAIILPNGLTYTFQYDNCGMLRKVTYPTGGYTRYDYSAYQLIYQCLGLGGQVCEPAYYQNQVIAKHVCPVPAMTLGSTTASAFSSSNQCPVAEQTTTYTPTTYNLPGQVNQQNTVVDPVENKIIYQFAQGDALSPTYIAPQVETSRQYYDASGKLWKTVTTQYTTTATPGSTLNDSVGTGSIPLPVLPTIQTTTLDNGMTSEAQWSYDIWPADQNDSVLTEERVYDYGQGAPGPLLKRTDYTWLHRMNPSAYGWTSNYSTANHICDRKTSEIVYDGSGKTLEQTTYTYDGNNNGPGGPAFLTKVAKWRSTDGVLMTTLYSYMGGSYGNVTQETDPKGNVTQYSYTDNYADGTNRNSGAFLTRTTDPLGHITQNQYYWGGGLVAATCGENFSGSCVTGLTSGADYASYTYDLMGRKTSTTTGDGGKTTNCYSDLGGTGCSVQGYPLQVTTTEAISSGVNKVSTSIAMYPINGLPAETTELKSDPSCSGGWVQVDTSYDLDGRKSTVTNPYCDSKANPTDGTTTYAYDGLSRVTQVTHPDGAFATNTYTGRAVLSADEGNGTHNIQRISQTDALGRLIYVCEVTGQTQQGSSNNTPSSCGAPQTIDISATGFLTTYGYDAANSNGPLDTLTNVTQGGVSRSFIYDSLGELRSASNPESGTTTYTYDNDGNLTSKTDARSIVTTYSYDALNRLLSKTYSDGTTPSSCFQYDQNASGRSIGRLTTEWTQMGTCPSAPPSSGILTQRTFAAYDPLGRVTSDQQCTTLGNCGNGYTPYTFAYGYDLAGDVTSFNNGLTSNSALSFTGQYNSAGHLATLSGSTSGGSSSTTSLFTNATYIPAGTLATALIGTGTTPNINFHRDYNNRLLPIDEIDTVATAPGNGSTQISGYPQVASYSYGSVTFSGTEVYETGVGYQTGTFEFAISTGSNPYLGSWYSVNYGQNDTPQTLASNLASQLTCANGGIVRGQAIGATTYFVSCATGPINQMYYSFTAFLAGGNYEYQGAPPPAFSVSSSGSTMTPAIPIGSNTVTFSGTEQNSQTGTFIFTVWADNGATQISSIEIEWGPSKTQVQEGGQNVATINGATTPASLAQALAAAFPSCSASGTEVSAAASGGTLTLVSCDGHSAYSINSSLAGFSSGSGPDFTAQTSGGSAGPPSALNIPAPLYDSGTVKLTVNGNQIATTSYGPGSDASSVVAGLISAGSNNPIVHLAAELPCTSCLQVTSISDGSASDYTFSITATTNYPSIFGSASFLPYPNPVTMTGGGGSAPLYNWAISSFAPNGEVLAMTDSVMGAWSYGYDDFNRLTSSSATAGADNGLILGWTYDRYGNRWAQNATGSGTVSAVQPQLSFSGNNNRVDGWLYDADGNLLNDGRNSYAYDAEGRVISINGGQTTYAYDADGTRVAKYSGSTLTAQYLLGLGEEQLTELNGSGGWVHSNIYAGGRLLATYEGPSGPAPNTYHFHLTDWLGTNRMQTTAAGGQEEVCYSYPFGDGLSCTGTDATEHHLTGKERDAESGLDYFGARYLNSNLGRWMSPDPTGLALATAEDPQTLNLYAYVNNNPVSLIDPDGLQAEASATGGCNWLCRIGRFFKRFGSSSGANGDGGGNGVNVGGGGGGGGAVLGGGWSSTPYPGKNLVNVYYPCGSFCIGGHASVGTYDTEDTNPKDPWSDPHNGFGFTTVDQHKYVRIMLIVGWPFFKGYMEADSHSPRPRIGVQYRYLPISDEAFDATNKAIDTRNGYYRLWLLPRNCANTTEDLDRAAGAHGIPHHEIFLPHFFWWLSPLGWSK